MITLLITIILQTPQAEKTKSRHPELPAQTQEKCKFTVRIHAKEADKPE